jgi:anti-sigma-K factor RskA
MSPTMTTPEREALENVLTRYALGELPRDEAHALERKLSADPELAAELRRLERAFDLLSYSAAVEPPPALRERVLGAAAAHKAAHVTRIARPWSSALAALAASVALAIGIDDYRVRGDLRELELHREVTQTLQQPNLVLSFDLRGTGSHTGSAGAAVLDLDAKRAAVVVRGLPVLPSDRVYRLWALVGEEPVPCGDFNADASGNVTRQFAIPVQQYTEPVRRLVVTVESSAPASRPEGPSVMEGTWI